MTLGKYLQEYYYFEDTHRVGTGEDKYGTIITAGDMFILAMGHIPEFCLLFWDYPMIAALSVHVSLCSLSRIDLTDCRGKIEAINESAADLIICLYLVVKKRTDEDTGSSHEKISYYKYNHHRRLRSLPRAPS